MARDLRTISAALKMITDMERICDQAADIGEIVLHFEDNAFSKNPQLLYHMAEQCVTMVTKAIDSFITVSYTHLCEAARVCRYLKGWQTAAGYRKAGWQ